MQTRCRENSIRRLLGLNSNYHVSSPSTYIDARDLAYVHLLGSTHYPGEPLSVIFDDLKTCEGMCVQLNVGREVWLATLRIRESAVLVDFRPTNEDLFEAAPRFPVVVDERLLSALNRDGRNRLIADAHWLTVAQKAVSFV